MTDNLELKEVDADEFADGMSRVEIPAAVLIHGGNQDLDMCIRKATKRQLESC